MAMSGTWDTSGLQASPVTIMSPEKLQISIEACMYSSTQVDIKFIK